MHRLIASLVGGLALTAVVPAATQSPNKEPGIHCTLTDKKTRKCCCEQRGEKLYCKLAKKTIEKCYCEPEQLPKAKKS